jgi:tetratricopeptide (TPR) repeat protein
MAKEIRIKTHFDNGTKFLNEIQYEKAINEFTKILNIEPENYECHYYLGIIHTNLNNHHEAIFHLEKSVEIEENYIYGQQVQTLLGYTYSKLKDYQNAEKAFLKALKYDNKDVAANVALSYIYEKTEKYEKAMARAMHAIDIDSKHAGAHNALGYLYLLIGYDVEKAIDECKTAIRLDPNNGAYYDSLGWAFYKKNEKSLAKKYLKKANELLPENPTIKSHLKEILGL